MRMDRSWTRLPVRLGMILFAALMAGACSREAPQSATEPGPIESLADEVLAATMDRYPQMATFYGIEGARHDRLYDNSLEALAAWQQREDDWLARLNDMPAPTEVGSRDWVTYGILHEGLESAVATRVCRDELWQASTTTSWHRQLPFVFEIQPVDTAEHRQQTLQRLRAVAPYIDTEIANLRQGLELGFSAPRVPVQAVPGQVRSLIGDRSIFRNPAGFLKILRSPIRERTWPGTACTGTRGALKPSSRPCRRLAISVSM